MNINLQLKKRREKINKEKTHERTKVIRQYKSQIANDSDLNNEKYKDTNQKLNDFQLREEKRINYEKQLYGDDINESENIITFKDKEKEKEREKENKVEKKKELIGNKRSREEIEENKQKKINKRKKTFKNLHKTNKYGQPLMKYQIANIFDKIKKKKKEGLI